MANFNGQGGVRSSSQKFGPRKQTQILRTCRDIGNKCTKKQIRHRCRYLKSQSSDLTSGSPLEAIFALLHQFLLLKNF